MSFREKAVCFCFFPTYFHGRKQVGTALVSNVYKHTRTDVSGEMWCAGSNKLRSVFYIPGYLTVLIVWRHSADLHHDESFYLNTKRDIMFPFGS